MKIKFKTIDKVKRFNKIISKLESDAIMKSGRYVIDAKSIMGIFSLDLSKELELEIIDNIKDNDLEVIENLRKLEILVD